MKMTLDLGWKAGVALGATALAGFVGVGIAEGASPFLMALGGVAGGAGLYSTVAMRRSSTASLARIQGEALDHLLMPVAVFDNDERLVLWNARYREAFENAFDRLEAAGNRNPTFRELVYAELGPDATDAERERAWIKAMEERPPADETFREFKCNTMGWVLVGRKIMPSGLELRVANDVNILKARQIALEAALERAREAERMTEELISAVSHDLRSPLASISSGAVLMQHAPDKVDTQEIAQMIVRTSSRMRQLIDGLLDSFGKKSVDQTNARFDLYSLVTSVVENAGFLPSARNLKLKVDWEKGLPAERIGSEQAIWQVLTNLTTNAVNYTDDGEVCIAVRDAGGDKLRIEVRDTGAGIPRDKQDGLFERYNRLGAYKTQGHGLGLSIVKEIVDALDGRIDVSSKPGVGTSFIITLRLPHGDEAESQKTAEVTQFAAQAAG
jgi:signal transduction histidine kinase